MHQGLYQYLLWINIRHCVLDAQWLWFELYDIFDENLKLRKEKYGDIIWDLYYDRVNKRMVSHIYDSNDWLYHINKNLEQQLNVFQKEDKQRIYNQIKLDNKMIVSQSNSLISRPIDLPDPNKYQEATLKDIDRVQGGFIRVLYYEKQLYTEDRFKDPYKEHSIYWEINFWQESKGTYNVLDIKSIYDDNLWIFYPDESYSFFPISYIKDIDMLENYKILWFSNRFLKELDLEVWDYTKGLYAKNKDWETVIKYNQWYSSYMWNEINHEIPRLNGAELLVREDYFNLMQSLHKEKATYYINIL